MKIGIIAHLKHPINAPFAGGLEVFTHQVTVALQALGHEVILFASSSSDPTLPLYQILCDGHYDKKSGIRKKTKDLPSEYISEHHAYFSLMMEIDNHGLDVIFNNSLHYIPITMAGMVATPMLTVLHTPPFYELEMAIRAEQRNPCIDYVTVSRQSALNWSDIIPQCKIILNGVKCDNWQFYPQPQADAYAVWFGRIHPDKGLHHAINAARAAGIPLRVAGGIADQRYFDKEIAPLLGPDITMLGILDHTTLNREIGLARVCLVTPCWQEPFGLVVAEAMTCGTPVAGFKMGALPELVTDETGELVDFADISALSDAIQTASQLNRKRIHDYAIEKFSFDQMVSTYEQLLEKVTAYGKNLKYTI